MKKVIIESPFAGKGESGFDKERDCMRNVRYLRACMRDSLTNHSEAPYASHGLYTQPGVLDDNNPGEREHGIQAGFEWGKVAEKRIFYTDLGTSRGMEYGAAAAKELGQEVEERQLGPGWDLSDGGVIVPPYLAAELSARLAGEVDKFTYRLGFSSAFVNGYKQGIEAACALILENAGK